MQGHIGKIYYSICDDNPDYYRTIRITNNPITGMPKSNVTGILYGTPPPTMEEIPPLLKSQIHSMNNVLPYNP